MKVELDVPWYLKNPLKVISKLKEEFLIQSDLQKVPPDCKYYLRLKNMVY